MSPFWSGFADHLKNCGQDTTRFLLTLGGLLGLIGVGAVVCSTPLGDYVLPALPWIGALLVIWACVLVRQVWLRRRQRIPRPPLSADEWLKARARLKQNRR